MSIQTGLTRQHANSQNNVHGYARKCQSNQLQRLFEDSNGRNNGNEKRKTLRHQFLVFILDITKAGAQSQIISYFRALKTSLLLRRGIALDCWSHRLSVILGKMFGCSLVTKLCSILLMEVGFNFANKTIYGGSMLDNVRKYILMQN